MRLKEIEYTSKEAAEAVGAWPQNISNAIAGRRKTAMGFQWRFACGGEIACRGGVV